MQIKLTHKILFTVILFIFLFILFNVKDSKAVSYIWPVGGDNATDTYVEYNYGKRTYDSTAYDKKFPGTPTEQYYSKNENHYGVDITGVKGKTYSVVSVTDGKVVATSANRWRNSGINFPDRNKRRSTQDGGGYGNYVVIQDSSNGKCFLYAHLKANTVSVKKGDTVKKGQQIAIMGSSGDSGHMHLHFEVRKNLKSVTTNGGGNLVSTTGYNIQTEDPLNYIVKPVINATLKSVTYSTQTDSTYVYLNFDRDISVHKAPVLNIRVGDTVLNAELHKTESQRIIYLIKHNKFLDTTYGKMTVECSDDGYVVTAQSQDTKVNCTFTSRNIGLLNQTAKLTDITYERNGNILKIYLNFDKEVKVNNPPFIAVQIGNYSLLVRKASLLSSKKSLLYTVDLDYFKLIASGQIYVVSKSNGSVVAEKSNTNRKINCTFSTRTVGTLDEYRLYLPFRGIIYEGIGDVNGDGQINASDASTVLSISAKLASTSNNLNSLTSAERKAIKYADVDKDGYINASDAHIILQYSAYIGSGTANNIKNALLCDFDNDNIISPKDYNNLVSHFTSNKNSEKYDEKFDLNKDGNIDVYDLCLFINIVKSVEN